MTGPARTRDAGAVSVIRRAAVLLVPLLLGGCAAGVGAAGPTSAALTPRTATPVATSTTTAQTPTATPTPTPTLTCGSGRPAGTVWLTMPGGRRVMVAVPAGDTGHRLLPVVIALPGYGRTSQEMADQSRIPARASEAGVISVIPQGTGTAKAWDLVSRSNNADVTFLHDLVGRLVAQECADPARIVITGISDGGDMAAIAACALPGTFRALVTVAASIKPRPGCRPTRILAIHGDADPLDPYSGGADGRPGYPAIPPALPAIAAWAELDGCATATTTQIAAHIVRVRYACGPELIIVKGGGHTWPGGAPVSPSLGVTTTEYDATAAIFGLL